MYIKEIFSSAIANSKPLLMYTCIIIITLRIAYLKKGKRKFNLCKEFITLLGILYLVLLYYLVIKNSHNGIYFIPLKEILNIERKTKLVRFISKNIVMFIPFGYFVSYILNNKKVLNNVLITSIISLLLEGLYYYINNKFSIDIILLNIVGSFIGYLIFLALSVIKEKLPRFMKSDWFCNTIVIIFICITLYFIIK